MQYDYCKCIMCILVRMNVYTHTITYPSMGYKEYQRMPSGTVPFQVSKRLDSPDTIPDAMGGNSSLARPGDRKRCTGILQIARSEDRVFPQCGEWNYGLHMWNGNKPGRLRDRETQREREFAMFRIIWDCFVAMQHREKIAKPQIPPVLFAMSQ